jgi:2-keto-4-pentenoate hydratase/2-oxohepta-3-ene-1,7-dioic acid hydratase in catechol pathway
LNSLKVREDRNQLKVAHFLQDKKESYGAQITEDQILDLPALSKILKKSIPSRLDELIQLNREGIKAMEHLIQGSTENERRKATVKLGDVKILAPIAWPPKIICLGSNYRDHAAELGSPLPDEPVIFMKPHTTIIGPDEPIVKPAFVKELDYEAELAVVIGKKGKNIAVEDAKNHIFGYTCFNDVSARDIQFKDKQWTRGKSLDTFAPIGPCITTADQIGDQTDLKVQTRVNGETRQDSSTSNMILNVYQIVYQLSRIMTLEPRDIIATGTPAGVAFAMKPKPKFLSPGDIVEIEIENIGTLRNKIAAA